MSDDVRCVIVNWNGGAHTLDCLASLAVAGFPLRDVIVVDNASADDSVARITAAHPEVDLVVMPGNGGFGSGANAGIAEARARGAAFVWILNNDTAVGAGACDALLAPLRADPQVAASASVLYHHDAPERIQAWGGGMVNTWLGIMRVVRRPRRGQLDYLSAASLMLRLDAIEQAGAFDERFFLYWEDTDLSFRLRRHGYRLAVAPASKVWHMESAGTGGRGNPRAYAYYVRSARRFFRKHAAVPWLPIGARLAAGLLRWGLLGDRVRVRALLDSLRDDASGVAAGGGGQAASPVSEGATAAHPGEPPPVPLVSVCIPVHNGVAHIREAIDSVLTQDYPNVRLRIVDNASTDGTRELAAAIDDPRVETFFHDEFVPVAQSWDRALQHGTGTYVLLLACDDALLPGALRKLVAAAERHPTSAVAFGRAEYVSVDGPGPALDRPSLAPAVGYVRDVERLVLERGYNIPIGGALFRRGVPGLRIDPRTTYAADMGLMLNVGSHGGAGIGITDAVVVLREHPHALSSNRTKMASATIDALQVHAMQAREPWLYRRRSERVLLWAVVRLLDEGQPGAAAQLVERHALACGAIMLGSLRAMVRRPWLRYLPLALRAARRPRPARQLPETSGAMGAGS